MLLSEIAPILSTKNSGAEEQSVSYETDSTAHTKSALRSLLASKSLVLGPVTLSTGQQSNYYFDCKRVTLDPEGASLVADAFIAELEKVSPKPAAIGGLSHGADPIVFATVMRAHQHRREQSLTGFYVRTSRKEHGTRRKVENAPKSGTHVVVIDDVVTSGSSVLEAVREIRSIGCDVVAVLALVDRDEGGADKIRAEGIRNYQAIFTRTDFPEIGEPIECPTTTSEPPSIGVSI